MDFTISIIVPMYNSSGNIRKCINSIIGQTYHNFELLLIDDGSTDNTLDICREYTDERIKIYTQNNSGASVARNKGIDISIGEWIIFVDSDDFISESYVDNLIHEVTDSIDMIMCGLTMHEHGGNYELFGDDINIQIDSHSFGCLYTLYNLLRRGGPVAKLYNSKIIKEHNIRFIKDARFGEDTIFLHNYLCFCKSVKIIGETGYHVVSSPNSVSKKLYDYKNELSTLNAFSNLIPWYIEHINSDEAKDMICKKKMLYLTRVILSLWKYSSSNKTKYEVLNSIDYSYLKSYDMNLINRFVIRRILLAGNIKSFILLLNIYFFFKNIISK